MEKSFKLFWVFRVSEFQTEGLVGLGINFSARTFGKNFVDSAIGLVIFSKI